MNKHPSLAGAKKGHRNSHGLDVTCPICNAPPGKNCMVSGFSPGHEARRILSQQKAGKQ